MGKIKLVTFTILAVLMLSELSVSPGFATDSTTFTLSSSTNQIQFKIPAGIVFNGSIATTGMVRFWVTAPDEVQIVNLGIVDKTRNFSFQALQNGTYTLNFENDLPNPIQVTLSYSTDPQVPGIGNSTGTSPAYLLITVLIAVAGSILIILLMRRRNKDQTVAQEPSGQIVPASTQKKSNMEKT